MLNSKIVSVNSTSARTLLAKKNILYSLALKVIGLLTMLMLVPLSINYLGDVNYGVWITVSGVIAWAGMFDFGFSHGLRNRLTEVLADKNLKEGRYLVSSTYFFMIILAVILSFIFYILINIIDWSSLLNLSIDFDMNMLHLTLNIIFLFFILQFTLKPINSILQAHQWPAIEQSLGTLAGVITIASIAVLYHYDLKPQLIYYAISVAGIPIIISVFASIYLFSNKFKNFRPSFSFIKIKSIKSIGGLGVSFFIIQLALLVVYSSDNLIISYLFGPKEVTTYNIVYRYFSLVTIMFTVIMTPFWSAITDAYAKDDMQWIERTIHSLVLVLLGGAIISILLAILSPWFLSLWISNNFITSPLLVNLMALYAVSMAWLNIFSFFSNGIGKIRVQMIAYIIASVINLPMSYYFGKVLNMGSSGVLLATIISMTLVSTVLTIQYFKVISNNSKGIWDR